MPKDFRIASILTVPSADNPEKQVQCIAYSLDKGRTWTKYKGNPVIDSKFKLSELYMECPSRSFSTMTHLPDGLCQKTFGSRGASGTYMLGVFDGKKFTPESGKYYYSTGSIYAAQTLLSDREYPYCSIWP